MANTYCTSKLILLGAPNTLEGFQRPEFLHKDFFVPCITRDECTKKVNEHANILHEMDIFLPDTAVDLIHTYGQTSPGLRKQFYLYCSTDDLVTHHKSSILLNICEGVFNANQIEEKLYKTAHLHLLRCKNYLEKCTEEGDDDADDLLLPMGELFAQSAIKINDMIRQKAGLPQQPADYEEG